MSAVLTLVGRLHPLLVHLPIGILLLGIFLEALSMRERYAGLKPAADLSLLIGVGFAALSCITGWLLSQRGDYDAGLVVVHQWLAISLTVVSAGLYFAVRRRAGVASGGREGAGVTAEKEWRGKRRAGMLMGVVLLLVVLTGHWGGSLTHGPGYLTADLGAEASQPTLRPVANIPAAVVYRDMVQPVLHDNCYGCHSASRIKGGLRLDEPARILRGGKDGPVIVPGQASASLLIKRVLLPANDDHHMAPHDKAQLTPMEIRLLRWWIDNGASFDQPVSRLPVDTGMALVLQAFHTGSAGPVASAAVLNVADSDLPMGPVLPAPSEAVARLRAAGALVLPVALGSNWLEVRFFGDTVGKGSLELLLRLKDQLVEVRFSGVKVGDEVVPVLAGCPRLVRVWLDGTRVTGKGFEQLGALKELKYLNLAGTDVGAADVLKLKGLPALAELYLYKSCVGRGDWGALTAAFPAVKLDSGGYVMPFLTTDTAVVRAFH